MIDGLAVEELDMAAPLNGLLRVGLALKLNQVKRATRSYLRDRTNQATDTATSYAVAAGLFAAAGVFLIAAFLVGLAALFRWIEIEYGLFQAFGAIGVLLVIIAALCAALAARKLRRPALQFPSFASRLRVAVKANPVHSDQVDAAKDTTAAVLLNPSTSARADRGPRKAEISRRRNNRSTGAGNIGAGLILAATLLGWAAVRRRQRARGTAA
jgi:hypothetical protein